MIRRISIWAKFLPRQLRGACANGENRSDCGFAAAMGQPTLAISSGTKARFGLKLSASAPQSSGFRCRGQLASCTAVPRGSSTSLPPGPVTVSSNWSRRKVPLATAGQSRRVSVTQRSMKGSRDKSRYVGSRPPWASKKASTSRWSSRWNSGCRASSKSIQVMVWPVVSWPANKISSMFPKSAEPGISEVATARERGPLTGRLSLGRAKEGSLVVLAMMSCMAPVRAPILAPPFSPSKVARISLFVASAKASGQPSSASCSCAWASCRKKSFMSTALQSMAAPAKRSAQPLARARDLGRISAREERGRKASTRCRRWACQCSLSSVAMRLS
mmetsp:Transcript_52582/g.152877  ORF Transcript_52582/g.152877 Transcript_52582/m.152877 type:complete len:331 (-) Transcript_52582:682-1674(-)